MILGKFYDQITRMAPGVWFPSYYSKCGCWVWGLWRGTLFRTGPKRLPLSHVRLIRRTRFAGPIERYFSRGSVAAAAAIYICKTAKDKSYRLYQWHIPLVLITDTDRLSIQTDIYLYLYTYTEVHIMVPKSGVPHGDLNYSRTICHVNFTFLIIDKLTKTRFRRQTKNNIIILPSKRGER